MLKNLIDKKRYSFHKKFDKWEDAIEAACKPLIEDKSIEKSYVESIIKNVKTYGPYIIIAPNICIPHAQEGQGVNETAICFMKTDEPVKFSENPEEKAQLFFVLASIDNEKHMKNLVNMCELVENEEVVKKLLDSKSVEDLKELINK